MHTGIRHTAGGHKERLAWTADLALGSGNQVRQIRIERMCHPQQCIQSWVPQSALDVTHHLLGKTTQLGYGVHRQLAALALTAQLRSDRCRYRFEVFVFRHPPRQSDKRFDSASHDSENNPVARPRTPFSLPAHPPPRSTRGSYIERGYGVYWTMPTRGTCGTAAQ